MMGKRHKHKPGDEVEVDVHASCIDDDGEQWRRAVIITRLAHAPGDPCPCYEIRLVPGHSARSAYEGVPWNAYEDRIRPVSPVVSPSMPTRGGPG